MDEVVYNTLGRQYTQTELKAALGGVDVVVTGWARPVSRVTCLTDAIHSIEWGESQMETVRLIGNAIVHVHLKDGTRPRDHNRTAYDLCALGAGDVDFDEVRKALCIIGYDGYLSLEWDPELAACYPSTEALLHAYAELLNKHFA